MSLGMPLGGGSFGPEILMPWLANLLPEGANLLAVGRNLGVSDSHAKNHSILLTGRGASLAPLYDLMCAAAWENVTKNLSQTIAGKDRGDHIKGRHWQRMADECGFNRTMILRRIEALAERARRELPGVVEAVRAMPGGDHPMLREFAAAIEARCWTVLVNLAHVEVDAENAMPERAEPPSALRDPL